MSARRSLTVNPWRVWLLVAVACWAAVAPAFATAFVSGFNVRGPKNRVWIFFLSSAETRQENRSQVADSHLEKVGHGYEVVSGVHVYLYANADPIGGRDPSGNFSLVELAIDTTIISTVNAIAAPAIARYSSLLIPQAVLDGMAQASPDAISLGLGANIKIPRIPLLQFTPGVEYLYSPRTHNSALYGYLGGALAASGGYSVSGSIGLVWNCKSSSDYEGKFLSASSPFSKLPSRVQASIRNNLAGAASALTIGTFSALGLNEITNPAAASLQAALTTINMLDRLSVNVFGWPGGSFGISIPLTLYESGTSSSRSLGISYYWQLHPGSPVAF